ncbi:DUF6092 family protein [Saccharopolyspora sp. NPDC047091]|uniref:DUF6092 family protein n=1 Tax=Saccharopolyspora sp. NPDC047091 TaxID=3155924 RepID=UPI00340F58FC
MSAGDVDPREELLLLAAFLLSSGRRQTEETRDYAVYRLVEGARRALLIAGSGDADPRLEPVLARLDEVVHAPPGSADLGPLLDDLCTRIAEVLQPSAEPPTRP